MCDDLRIVRVWSCATGESISLGEAPDTTQEDQEPENGSGAGASGNANGGDESVSRSESPDSLDTLQVTATTTGRWTGAQLTSSFSTDTSTLSLQSRTQNQDDGNPQAIMRSLNEGLARLALDEERTQRWPNSDAENYVSQNENSGNGNATVVPRRREPLRSASSRLNIPTPPGVEEPVRQGRALFSRWDTFLRNLRLDASTEDFVEAYELSRTENNENIIG